MSTWSSTNHKDWDSMPAENVWYQNRRLCRHAAILVLNLKASCHQSVLRPGVLASCLHNCVDTVGQFGGAHNRLYCLISSQQPTCQSHHITISAHAFLTLHSPVGCSGNEILSNFCLSLFICKITHCTLSTKRLIRLKIVPRRH